MQLDGSQSLVYREKRKMLSLHMCHIYILSEIEKITASLNDAPKEIQMSQFPITLQHDKGKQYARVGHHLLQSGCVGGYKH